MRYGRWIGMAIAAAACMAAAVAVVVVRADPSTQPAPAQPIVVPPQLKLMSSAYAELKSLSLKGTIQLAGDINGQKVNDQIDFTSSFAAPLKFRHEVTGDVIVDGTGDKIFMYLPDHNIYLAVDSPIAPSGKTAGNFDALCDDVRDVLWKQDVSLALALSGDAAAELLSRGDPAPAADVTIDGQVCPAVMISGAALDTTVILNPTTHLVRRVIVDELRALRARGADVKVALITIDYQQTVPDAKVTADQFAFTPPATAKEVEPEGAAAMALIGKPVPHFDLPRLDGGQKVSDAGLRGSAYILDFWATWCGPCAISLPGLQAIYQDQKGSGLKVFTVNSMEDTDKVKDYVATHKLALPVLLDGDGSVAKAFGVDPIPQTVVVGRDGLVKNVFLGFSEDQEKLIATSAQRELDAR